MLRVLKYVANSASSAAMVDNRHQRFWLCRGGFGIDGKVIGDDYNGEDRIWALRLISLASGFGAQM